MNNVHKCLALLESLEEPLPNFTDIFRFHFGASIVKMENTLNLSIEKLNFTFESTCKANTFEPTDAYRSWNFCGYLFIVLQTIVQQHNDTAITDDPNETPPPSPLVLSDVQDDLIKRWLERLAILQLIGNVDEVLLQCPYLQEIAKCRYQKGITQTQRNDQLLNALNDFDKHFMRSSLLGCKRMDDAVMFYVIGIYHVIIDRTAKETETASDREAWDRKLDAVFAVNRVAYVRAVMMLKLNRALAVSTHERLHCDLLERLQSAHGFETITRTLLRPIEQPTDGCLNVDDTVRQRSDMIAGICGRRGHKRAFYASIRPQCESLLQRVRHATNYERHYAIVCLDTMMKIHGLQNGGAGQALAIERFVFAALSALAEPGDILAGRLVLEHVEFVDGLQLVYDAFMGSVAYRLPSRLLVVWLPLLLGLHAQLTLPADSSSSSSSTSASAGSSETNATRMSRSTSETMRRICYTLITYCLANAPAEDFGTFVDVLLMNGPNEHDDRPYRWLHPRLEVTVSQQRQLTCRITTVDNRPMYKSSATLVDVLRRSENNILIYKVFLHLLRELNKYSDSEQQNTAELLGTVLDDEDDMEASIRHIFDRRICVITTLQALIEYRPFHCQFNENPGDGLKCMTQMLRKRVEELRKWRAAGDVRRMEADDASMLVLLTLVQEFVARLTHRRDSSLTEFAAVLYEYQELCVNAHLQHLIRAIRSMLRVEEVTTEPVKVIESKFEAARLLCTSKEAYVKGYGLRLLRNMAETGTDVEVLANRHTVLMVAMDALAHEDSYVYLSSVRLLASLDKLLNADLIETIVAEYHRPDAHVDYRLKVGEALVKLTEELGTRSYKYKEALIRCFLIESRSEIELLRISSLSSLASLLRLFVYEVRSFFQELHDLALYIIVQDRNVLCRRAAVMMISHLMFGFDELHEFQDILLPLYRALKHVMQNETDETTLIHARIGLDQLKNKVKDYLLAEQIPQKIRISGVEPTTTPTWRTKSILEML